jgi:FtsX extracellular domain
MHDLDIRLERLAAEATRDAVPPEPEAVARRGRRRRRRQLAGSALVVAAVVAAGLVLPSRLAPGPGSGAPAAAPPTDVAGAATLGGYWFGKADASVFLRDGITPAQRRAVRERIEALDVVDRVYHESREDAQARVRELYRTKAQVLEKAKAQGGLEIAPESFRVRLRAPEDFARLARALCPLAPEKVVNRLPCMDGVEVVVQSQVLLKPLLVPKPLVATSDVTVLLTRAAGPVEPAAVRARLEAIDGVAMVTYMTPEEAFRRLPEKLRRDGQDPAKVTPLYSPASLPAAFHVTLDRPARAAEFHQALCGSRTTGKCAGGLVVLEHPRGSG